MNKLMRFISAAAIGVTLCVSLSGCALPFTIKDGIVAETEQTEIIQTESTPVPQEPATTEKPVEATPEVKPAAPNESASNSDYDVSVESDSITEVPKASPTDSNYDVIVNRDTGTEVPKVSLTDGDYYVIVNRDSITETSYGWSFEGDAYVKVGFTTEQINALHIGDFFEGYEVEYLERISADWTNPASTALVIGDHGAYFWQDRKAGCWYFVTENDYVLREMISTEVFCLTAGETEIFDAFTPGEGKVRHFDWYDGTEQMTQVGSLFDCLRAQDENGYVVWHGPVTVTVKDGTVTRVVFEYAP